MQNDNKKIYPKVSTFSSNSTLKTSFDSGSPWKNANVSFHWINFEFPKEHSHYDWEFLLVLQGSITHIINGKKYVLHAGDACFIGPKDTHSFTYINNNKETFQGASILVRDIYLQSFTKMISRTLYDSLINHKAPLSFAISPSSLEKYTNILLNIQSLDNNVSETFKDQCILVFNHLLLNLVESTFSQDTIPNVLKPFVKKLNIPTITHEEIKLAQEELPYSYSQLTRIFKKHIGVTITVYINTIKLNHAKELLESTDLPVSIIVEKLGFESISYFHRIFKKNVGVTPYNYRNYSTKSN